MIRYSHHDSYNLWTSVVYLCFSILFFLPFLVLCLYILKKIQIRFENWFWPLTFLTAFCCLIVFYLVSNIILHSFGYFDFFVDADYAGYYFGREALYHLLFVLGTGIYVYVSKEKTRTIKVFKGRKTVTLTIDLVQWIEVEGHYLNFYTKKETYIKRTTLGQLAKQLQPDFIRIHRKYIVNRNEIVAIEKEGRDEFTLLSSGKKLKIGPSYSPISW
ncbi:LytTR family transcriptional regulator [Muricauda sp. CAU 1633]|uniref:LytR/AlgR family response regulator transcription factor n=1 Tax=Allomuricauda sp. CAU 1633 TaxID=2816036 RepID=UPI001A8F9BF0|nr:LytTR family DNA-binding domain-containing protein [Muricauda sp. CAU 1633]MBO0323177.1 LytTR family transcriptional regulator [Muricauda sp. CAU 1633]